MHVNLGKGIPSRGKTKYKEFMVGMAWLVGA